MSKDNVFNDSWEPMMALDKIIAELNKKYGLEFGLRAYPGEVFIISSGASFMNGWGEDAVPVIYTYRKVGEKFLAFAKGSVAECHQQFVKLS